MPLRRCGKHDHANVFVHSASLGYKTVGGVDLSSSRSQTHPVVCVGELNRFHFESCKMPRSEKEKTEDRHVNSWSSEAILSF